MRRHLHTHTHERWVGVCVHGGYRKSVPAIDQGGCVVYIGAAVMVRTSKGSQQPERLERRWNQSMVAL